mmetsp:Transcript_6495/g.16165  ORF Transcript_6495/g.16165 Transcript_6495/m.16165 type:complete len:202 (-) Transcript_6495:65-670(-)
MVRRGGRSRSVRHFRSLEDRVGTGRATSHVCGGNAIVLSAVQDGLVPNFGNLRWVVQQRHERGGLLTYVDALVASAGLLVLERLQPLQLADAAAHLAHNLLRALRDQELHHRQRLVHVTPLLIAVLQPRPQLLHHQRQLVAGARGARDLGHQRAVRAPVLLARRLEYLDLHLGQPGEGVAGRFGSGGGFARGLGEVFHRAV